jgi:hypothetical protein
LSHAEGPPDGDIFCGLHKLASVEDVIPKWVRYALEPTSPVTIRAESTGASARTQHLVVVLRDSVCEECNNGWMHDLEEQVKPFVKPMLTHQDSVDLDATRQRDLARWAVMKVLLMEHVMRQQNPRLRTTLGYEPSGPELAWLMTEADPPPRSRVWVGAFDAAGTQAISTQTRLLMSPLPDGADPLPAHMTTLTIGCMLLQVFTTDFVPADAHSLPPYTADPPEPYSQALTRIWPTDQATVHWPPRPLRFQRHTRKSRELGAIHRSAAVTAELPGGRK